MEAAAYCAASGRADLAAELRALKKPGPPKSKGPTPHNLALARLWVAFHDRVSAGEDEGEIAADLIANAPVPLAEDAFWNLIALEGRPAVRAILKEWGRISEKG
jgi:hypothetical protein